MFLGTILVTMVIINLCCLNITQRLIRSEANHNLADKMGVNKKINLNLDEEIWN